MDRHRQPLFPGWSTTIQNLPEGSVVQTLNLESRHPKILLPIIQNMVTNFPKDYHSKNGHPQWFDTSAAQLVCIYFCYFQKILCTIL